MKTLYVNNCLKAENCTKNQVTIINVVSERIEIAFFATDCKKSTASKWAVQNLFVGARKSIRNIWILGLHMYKPVYCPTKTGRGLSLRVVAPALKNWILRAEFVLGLRLIKKEGRLV